MHICYYKYHINIFHHYLTFFRKSVSCCQAEWVTVRLASESWNISLCFLSNYLTCQPRGHQASYSCLIWFRPMRMMGLYDFAVLDHLLAGLFNRSKMLLWKKRFAVFSTLKAVSNSGLVDVSCMKYFCFPSYICFSRWNQYSQFYFIL